MWTRISSFSTKSLATRRPTKRCFLRHLECASACFASCSQIYERTCKPMVSFFLNKGKATCFAYGQTGSFAFHAVASSSRCIVARVRRIGQDVHDDGTWRRQGRASRPLRPRCERHLRANLARRTLCRIQRLGQLLHSGLFV